MTSAIPLLVSQTQVGIWVKSRKNVMIKDFTAICKQPEVFIVSQFGGDYDILYDEVIKPVCIKLHYDPIRGDEVASCSMILSDIITSIQNSAVIIADITPDNPNVFYEIGYAHALKNQQFFFVIRPSVIDCHLMFQGSERFSTIIRLVAKGESRKSWKYTFKILTTLLAWLVEV